MIYAMSDIHGCYEKYRQMLDLIRFGEEDTLYILGDVVDRGPDGIRTLLDMMGRKNIVPLRGNHEVIAMSLLKKLTEPLIRHNRKLVELIELWQQDGGKTTCQGFLMLDQEARDKVLNYMNRFLIYEELTVNSRKFFLSHTIPEKEKMLDFDSCRCEDFVMGKPEYDKQYFADSYLITGHTLTGLIESSSLGKIWRSHHHIAIDCGAVFGNPLGCICLDTMEEFYVD